MLLFGLETCVFTPFMGKALGGFQDQVDRHLMVRIPQKKLDGKWTYTSAVPDHGRTVHRYEITVRPV